MKLPLSIAQKLQVMIEGASIPASGMQHAIVLKMIEDGVIQKRQLNKTRAVLVVNNILALKNYLSNYSIHNLEQYIEKYQWEGLNRSDSVLISGNSKLKVTRTFKGFLVNCYHPVPCSLKNQPLLIQPQEGTYTFVSDYETFIPDENTTIVGIENAENFRFIAFQQYLFTGIEPLFICRYPYSSDVIKWLQAIPNAYLHFGDFDFEGIQIFLNEYNKHLGSRARFFIPEGIEVLLQQYGNREIYNRQLPHQPDAAQIDDPAVLHLLSLMHKYKKGLEQEVLIRKQN